MYPLTAPRRVRSEPFPLICHRYSLHMLPSLLCSIAGFAGGHGMRCGRPPGNGLSRRPMVVRSVGWIGRPSNLNIREPSRCRVPGLAPKLRRLRGWFKIRQLSNFDPSERPPNECAGRVLPLTRVFSSFRKFRGLHAERSLRGPGGRSFKWIID